jgi:flagellin
LAYFLEESAMGLRIKSNVESLVAQRALGDSRKKMEESLQKLSSGYRINKSADDAAGLAVSETMQAKLRSLGQAKRNASDGISFLQVAEGGLSEINNMVVRMRELATQAASDTIGETERGFLNREFRQLSQEIVRITKDTEFNGRKVLSADDAAASDGMTIQIGAGFRGPNSDSAAMAETETVTLSTEDVSKVTDAIEELKEIEINGASGKELNGDTNAVYESIDKAMTNVTDFRATLGAMQSRMSSVITGIDVSSENMAAAQARIRDVDYASETAKLTQARILTAAGTSVLSQANALPETVLQLLRA